MLREPKTCGANCWRGSSRSRRNFDPWNRPRIGSWLLLRFRGRPCRRSTIRRWMAMRYARRTCVQFPPNSGSWRPSPPAGGVTASCRLGGGEDLYRRADSAGADAVVMQEDTELIAGEPGRSESWMGPSPGRTFGSGARTCPPEHPLLAVGRRLDPAALGFSQRQALGPWR